MAALGLLSGMAWMVRPGLLWIPLATGMIVLGLGTVAAWRSDRRALLFPVVFAVALGLAAVPQLSMGEPFKFGLARLQAGLGDLYFRYATDVTGCGPVALYFSPLADEAMAPEAAGGLAPDSVQWQITVAIAHVVSGWDARPSPTYIESFADRRVAGHVRVLRVRHHGRRQRHGHSLATAPDLSPTTHGRRRRARRAFLGEPGGARA